MRNSIRGRYKLNRFQLGRGYFTAIVGIHASVVTEKMTEAYISASAALTIQKAIWTINFKQVPRIHRG